MMLTLHKGGVRPDTTGDEGVHYMKYAILPHKQAFSAETVVKPAYQFNYKPVLIGGRLNVPKLFEISEGNIICETVKNAEDIENAYVLRLYECERSTTECKLTLYGAKRVFISDMLEENLKEIELSDGVAALSFRPFEIKTIIVER